MQRIKMTIFFSLIVALVPVTTQAINPQQLTAEEYTHIERHCKEAQRSMQRIKYVDPVYRVNRGVAYSTLSKLMSALTNRAAYNAFKLPKLSQETNAIQDLRVQFGRDYTDYEIALSNIISFNCQDDPIGFYQRLVDVRDKRSIVALRIREIERRLDSFAQATVELDNLISLQVRP